MTLRQDLFAVRPPPTCADACKDVCLRRKPAAHRRCAGRQIDLFQEHPARH
jgi:hypothetical protein